MRLLNTDSLKLEFFAGDEIPEYAILSHRWEAEEILFEDVQTNEWPQKKGADKVKRACLLAKGDGFEYIWIDTCCIDKSSSAELSEAINSMFNWYHDSQVCYVYLLDVPIGETEAFAKSVWFTRGWTLQELIAPRKVEFFDSQWRKIGDRLSLLDPIVKVTTIDRRVLDRGRHHRLCPRHVQSSSGWVMVCDCTGGNHYYEFRRLLLSFSVARRMSWASTRVTTRVEDRAYALLGLFDVNMPLLYGEGRKAFRRLQEEIIRNSSDHSILASQHKDWDELGTHRATEEEMEDRDDRHHLFPSHPRAFQQTANLERPSTSSEYLSMTLTNRCLNIALHVCSCQFESHAWSGLNAGWLGILDCVYSDDYLSRPAILLDRLSSAESGQHVFTRINGCIRTLVKISPGALSYGDVEISEGGLKVWFNPNHIKMMNIDLLLHPPTHAQRTRIPAITINPTIEGYDHMTYRIRTWFPDLEETPNGNVRKVPFILKNLQSIRDGLPGLLAIDDGSSHGFFVAYGISESSHPSTQLSFAHFKFDAWCRLLAWHRVVPDREFIPPDDKAAIITLQEDMARFNYSRDNGSLKPHEKPQPRDSMDWPGKPGLRAQVAMTPNTFLGQTVYEMEICICRLDRREPLNHQRPGVQVMAGEIPSTRSLWHRLRRT